VTHPHHESTTPMPEGGVSPHGDAMRRTARIAVVVALSLVIAKLTAWWLSKSTALLASLTDSCLDLLASSLNAWAIQHALEPPDREHRFGHGKLESLAGLGQSVFVGVAAISVGYSAGLAVWSPEPLQRGPVAIAVMLLSIGATLWLVRLQRQTAELSGSVAIEADALHYVGDIAQNSAVLLGIGAATWLDWTWVDGAVGFAVALWILRSAVEIGRQSVDDLLDAELEDDTRAELAAIIAADPQVRGVHDLRTRRSGPSVLATVHIAVDAELTVRRAHRVAARVEHALLRRWPAGHFVLHVDPDDHEAEDPFGDLEGDDAVAQAMGSADVDDPSLQVREGERPGSPELATEPALAHTAEGQGRV
jgi:ferrous-iron efflux pump FieF